MRPSEPKVRSGIEKDKSMPIVPVPSTHELFGGLFLAVATLMAVAKYSLKRG